jgi:hypothetical protein
MVGVRRKDMRLLSEDEQELLAQSRHPTLKGLSDKELVTLAESLRTHRERAQEMSKYLRREMRDQMKRMDLTTGSRHGGGRAKLTLLAGAVKRTNKELQRRLQRKTRQPR